MSKRGIQMMIFGGDSMHTTRCACGAEIDYEWDEVGIAIDCDCGRVISLPEPIPGPAARLWRALQNAVTSLLAPPPLPAAKPSQGITAVSVPANDQNSLPA